MLAQVLTTFGGPENFKLQDFPKPDLVPGSALVRIAAASVNPMDMKLRQGLAPGVLPTVLGADMAGRVEAVSGDVSDFKPGDEVFGLVGGLLGMPGTYAEYIAADVRLLAPKPRSLSLRDAAGVPLVALTAWEAVERLELSPGDHVLVHGGTGGVGHIAVQLAKMKGARVATTVDSGDAAALARRLSADETIDYRQEAVAAYVRRLTSGVGFDAIFDTVGGANLANSFAAARTNGRISATNGRSSVDLTPMHDKALTLSIVYVMLPLIDGDGRECLGHTLREIATLVDAGLLHPLVDPAHFDLNQLPDAHRYLASGKARGKVVIDVAS